MKVTDELRLYCCPSITSCHVSRVLTRTPSTIGVRIPLTWVVSQNLVWRSKDISLLFHKNSTMENISFLQFHPSMAQLANLFFHKLEEHARQMCKHIRRQEDKSILQCVIRVPYCGSSSQQDCIGLINVLSLSNLMISVQIALFFSTLTMVKSG